MNESARVANAPRTKLLSKTVVPFKVIPETPDTITVDGNCIHNPVSIDLVTLVPYNA